LAAARVAFEALGTTCEVFAVGAPAQAVDWTTSWVVAMHARLSRFDPASEVSRFNAAAGTGWIPVSAVLEALLREALSAYRLSGGLVHAGVLPALLAAGYTRPLRDGTTEAALAEPAPLAPLPDLLQVESGRARLAPGAGIDLGGIAKGWLADRLCRLLGTNCLVNLGGDLYASGGGPDGEGWPVGFAGQTLLLRDAGAATSSVAYRRWGEGLHHLIDPRTGLPLAADLEHVSVVAADAFTAEVVAKTALMMGSAAAPAYLSVQALAWAVA
jgi:thiamine biosynthesis lipoprotein